MCLKPAPTVFFILFTIDCKLALPPPIQQTIDKTIDPTYFKAFLS